MTIEQDAVERFQRYHVRDPGTLSRSDARRLSDADGPAPAPSPVVDDEIARAAWRLFDVHEAASA